VVICLERGADLCMAQMMPLPLTVSCFSKIQMGFTFLVPADPGSPRKWAVKWVYVCMLELVSQKIRKWGHIHTHPFSGTARVSQYQKGKNQPGFHGSNRSVVGVLLKRLFML